MCTRRSLLCFVVRGSLGFVFWACFMLFDACCLVLGLCRALSIVCYVGVVGCVLFVGYCLLSVGCRPLFAMRCVLFVVR